MDEKMHVVDAEEQVREMFERVMGKYSGMTIIEHNSHILEPSGNGDVQAYMRLTGDPSQAVILTGTLGLGISQESTPRLHLKVEKIGYSTLERSLTTTGKLPSAASLVWEHDFVPAEHGRVCELLEGQFPSLQY